MGRKTIDTDIKTREARRRLKRQKHPYWRSVRPELFIGYYKLKNGGKWTFRCYLNGKYHFPDKTYIADDNPSVEADGLEVFSFEQITEKAMEFSKTHAMKKHGVNTGKTVNDAIETYLKWFRLNRKSIPQTEAAINAHIKPSLGKYKLSELSTPQLRKWLENLTEGPKRLRSSKKKTNTTEIDLSDPETLRKRKSTANKNLNYLKAILNHAWEEGLCDSTQAWDRVQGYRNADKPRVHFLTQKQAKALIDACDDEFRPLALAGLLTGCRYGELVSLRCKDFTLKAKTIFIAQSKTGKTRTIPLNAEGVELFTPLCRNRPKDDFIFVHLDGSKWGSNHQERPMIEAVERAKIPKEPDNTTFYTLRHTFAANLAMQGVSMRALAELMGNSVSICEKYYAHIGADHLAEAIRNYLPSYAETESNVVSLEEKRHEKR